MKPTKHSSKKFNHYILLASILGAGFSMIGYYKFNKEAQGVVILFTAISYILWGIIHHKISHYLTYEIIFEYVLVAVIGSLVILSLIGY